MLFADPPEPAARQGQSPQGIKSGLSSGKEGQGEPKGSAVFEEPTEQETEADREFALQILRRRQRRQMKESDASSVSTAEEGEPRKVSKRSIVESEDNLDCIEDERDDVNIELARKRLKVEDAENKGLESVADEVEGEVLSGDGEEECPSSPY